MIKILSFPRLIIPLPTSVDKDMTYSELHYPIGICAELRLLF